MAITPNKDAIEAAGLEYIEPHEIVKDTGPKALNLLAQAVVDLQKSGTGGFYLNDKGQRVDYVFVASDTDPGKTKTIDGKTYEVWWVQTTPPDPNAWVPEPVTADLEARTYTVPSDPGATYTVGGALKAAGFYPVTGSAAQTLTWSATPRSGYTFASGATTSGAFNFPVWSPKVGTVLMSDSFNRADGSVIGTISDSYSGGQPWTWAGAGDIKIRNNAVGIDDGSTYAGHIDYLYAKPQDNFDIEVTYRVPLPAGSLLDLGTTGTKDNKVTLTPKGTYSWELGGGGVTEYAKGLLINAGDAVRYTSTGSLGDQVITMTNITTGQTVSNVNRTTATQFTRLRLQSSTASGIAGLFDSIIVRQA